MATPATLKITAPKPDLDLIKACELDAIEGEIADLAADADLVNPFFLPGFLGPALAALKPRGDVWLAVVRSQSTPILFAPLVEGRKLGNRISRTLRVWTHRYAPLGLPISAPGQERKGADILLRELKLRGVGHLQVPEIPLTSPGISQLREANHLAGGREFRAAIVSRPILRADQDCAASWVQNHISKKKRKELARQWRRLEDEGGLKSWSAKCGPELTSAAEIFLQLEQSGWKGRAGSALLGDRDATAFGRSAIMGMARSGNAGIDILETGGHPVAALVTFTAGSVAVPWKIAFDETYGRYSPGIQLLLKATRSWLEDPAIKRVDPLCSADNPALHSLWDEFEDYGTLHFSLAGSAWPAQIMSAAETAGLALKSNTRGLRGRMRATKRKFYGDNHVA